MKPLKITLITIFLLFLIWTGFRILIDQIIQDIRGESISDSIIESKLNGALVCEYKITHVDSSVIDVLSKFGYLKTLDSVEIWLEKRHIYENHFIYFNEIVYLDNYRIVMNNPTEFKQAKDSTLFYKILKAEYPEFGIGDSLKFGLVDVSTASNTIKRIKYGIDYKSRTRSGSTGHNFSQRVLNLTLSEPTNEIDIWIYLAFSGFKVDDIIAGKIHLKSNNKIFKTEFKDPRPWWEKVNP